MKTTVLLLVALTVAGALEASVELVRVGDFAPAKNVQFVDSSDGREMVLAKPGGQCAWTFRLDPKWAVVFSLTVPLACVDVKGGCPTRIRELPPELNGLSNGDWSWHGGIDHAAFTDDVKPVPHFYADVPVETDDPYRYFHW